MQGQQGCPALAIQLINCATNDRCAICGARTDPECGPELFVAGTESLVCYECGRKYEPELVDTLVAYRAHFGGISPMQDDPEALLDRNLTTFKNNPRDDHVVPIGRKLNASDEIDDEAGIIYEGCVTLRPEYYKV
jgi:hypothetical protein